MKSLLTFAAALVFALSAGATEDCIPAKPANETVLVWQFTPFLAPQEEAQLNARLVGFAQRTSNRIAIIVVDTLCGLEPYAYATAIGRDWGIGGKEHDNGVVILVKPHGPKGQRHVFIAPGRGLEGALPDATCKRIVEEEMLPAFRNGRYALGLNDAVDVIMKLAAGEISQESYSKDPFPWVPIVVVLFIFFAVIMAKVLQARRYARVNDVDFWVAWALLNQAARSSSGRWGGFTGGGWSGGGGGGGFGGFGGGSFGGGGAGGSW